MSFAQETKNSLCTINMKSSCCKEALLYGILRYSAIFRRDGIKLSTENAMTASLFSGLCKSLKMADPHFTASNRESSGRRTVRYIFNISADQGAGELFEYFGADRETINREFFRCPGCSSSFARGAFLASGTVSDPEASYRVDIRMPSEEMADDFALFLSENGIESKALPRSGRYIVCIKESGGVQDFLTFIGAQHSALEVIEKQIFKEVRNHQNRVNNLDTANIYKTTLSARRQMLAIVVLEKNGVLQSLPEGMRMTAEIRRNNPYASLAELENEHKRLGCTITRAGIVHRLDRFLELAGIVDDRKKITKD